MFPVTVMGYGEYQCMLYDAEMNRIHEQEEERMLDKKVKESLRYHFKCAQDVLDGKTLSMVKRFVKEMKKAIKADLINKYA